MHGWIRGRLNFFLTSPIKFLENKSYAVFISY